MDTYTNPNCLNVRKSVYTGTVCPKQSRAQTPSDYQRTHKTTAVSAKSRAVSQKEGFAYVEHCDFKGTMMDVFHTKKVGTKKTAVFDKVVTIVLFAVLMFFVACVSCEYLDTYKDIKRIETEIGECREQQTKLLMAIQERDARIGVEEYAVSQLGMVKTEKLTRHYVNISQQDVVTVNEVDENEAFTGGVLLSGFKNIINNVVMGK